VTYPYHMYLWDKLQRMKADKAKAARIKADIDQSRNKRFRNAVQVPLL